MLVALGTPLRGRPRPWEHFKVPAIMANAYEIIRNQTLRQDIQAKGGIHEFLGYDGIVLLDSGGFQAMIYGIDIKLEKLVEVYRIAQPDYCFSLDYPSSSTRNSKRKIARTIANYEEMRKSFRQVIPVIHPKLERALKEYEAYQKHSPEYVAIGGLVPMMRTTKGVADGRKKAIDLIAEIRRRHNAFLHIMGLGAPTIVPILKSLNCTSTDSATWRIKAAHGKIMLPSMGERYVSNKGAKFGIVTLSDAETELIERLECPILAEYGWEGLVESFEARALFNAWISVYANDSEKKINGPFNRLHQYAQERATAKYPRSVTN
jgi:queuine/archaeosine tRNA-ribosyltransferase